jgi:hypothetical protein
VPNIKDQMDQTVSSFISLLNDLSGRQFTTDMSGDSISF